MADEAIQLFRGGERPAPRNTDTGDTSREGRERVEQVMFDRKELGTILSVYGRKVAEGEWRDYAIGAGREAAVFAVFQRTSEMPLYRIEKRPKLRRAQGLYCVVAATGLVLKRGHDLAQVLRVLEAQAAAARRIASNEKGPEGKDLGALIFGAATLLFAAR